MNTIPLIFNERQIKRTVLGGRTKPLEVTLPITVLLLTRGGSHFRLQQLKTLLSCGYAQIICVENSAESYSLEEWAQRFPSVKFIMPLEELTPGDMVNIGMQEADTEYVFVLWDDISIGFNMVSKEVLHIAEEEDIFCLSPFLRSNKRVYLPVRMVPSVHKMQLQITPESLLGGNNWTVYPFDGIGLFNRQKFMQLGGYDYTITNSYWQLLDFSLRAWLWGEKILLSSGMKIKYEEMIPETDFSADKTQFRFYLKNCAPIFKIDYAYIPKNRFFAYARHVPKSFVDAFRDFSDARNWVEKNKFRFKTDMIHLVENWECSRGDLV